MKSKSTAGEMGDAGGSQWRGDNKRETWRMKTDGVCSDESAVRRIQRSAALAK